MKKIFMFITLLLLSVNVFAKNTIDFNNDKGTINMALSTNDITNGVVSGAEIEIIKVAEAYENKSNLYFRYTDEFKSISRDITKLNSNNMDSYTSDIKSLVDNTDSITGIKNNTDNNGKVTFNKVDLGIYYVRQTNDVEGYRRITEFLISIPTIENNDWILDIDCTPKVEVDRKFDLVIRKVWENRTRFDNYKELTVALINDELDYYEEFIISEENNWELTVKDLYVSDSYRIEEITIPDGFKETYKEPEYIEEGNLLAGYVLTVVNTSTKLPQTGQNTYIVYIFAVLGLICITTGCYLDRKYN